MFKRHGFKRHYIRAPHVPGRIVESLENSLARSYWMDERVKLEMF